MRIVNSALCLAAVALASVSHAATPNKAHPARPTYKDPFSYCRAVGTADYPGRSYRGPQVPSRIAQAVGSTKDDPGRVEWRCDNGTVLACITRQLSGAGCEQMSSNRKPWREQWDWCRDNPNADLIPANVMGHQNIYLWRCVGTVPTASRQSGLNLDRRGFVADEWKAIRQ